MSNIIYSTFLKNKEKTDRPEFFVKPRSTDKLEDRGQKAIQF